MTSTVQLYLKRALRAILDYLATLVGYFSEPKRGLFSLPPINNPLLLEPAFSVAGKIRTGQYKSEHIVQSYIDRINEVDGYINSFVHKRFEAALAEAREIDRKIAEHLEKENTIDWPLNSSDSWLSDSSRPLLGVPFTGKDSIAVKGLYWTAGLYSRKGQRAAEDSDVVANLKKAGAICLGLTNCPELAFWWDSDNRIYGRTNNPYDMSRIPGGSTGGNGACLGYAGSVIGTGGDIGGSIRMPCFFCGIFGHKPTPGIVPTGGHYPPVSEERLKYLSLGPMCRYAEDLSPMFQIMAGKEAIERFVPKVAHQPLIDFRKIKIYYMDGSGDPMTSPVDQELRLGIRSVAKHFFTTYGTQTKRVDLAGFKDSFDIFLHTFKKRSAKPLMAAMGANGDGKVSLFFEFLKSLVGLSNHTLPIILVAFLENITLSRPDEDSKPFIELGEKLKRDLHKLLGEDGIFLYPTHPEVAPKHKTTILKMHNVSYTSIFNILEVPITQCPLGLNKEGLPLGVQVCAAPFNDHLTLAFAREIETKFGGWVPPCKVDPRYRKNS